MKIIARLFFATALVAQISCADFFNSSDRAAAENGPREKTGANPFPAEYDPTVGPFSESKMLAHIGLNIIAPMTRELRLHAENLQLELAAWRAAAESGDEPAAALAQRAAEERWTRTMLLFHQMDAAPVGPASDNGGTLGQQIYGWPDFNACGIDLEMVKYATTGKAPGSLIYTLKGLGALEYLLFEKSLSTQCNRSNPRNQPAVEWTTKDPRRKWLDRATFATVVAADLVEQARKLEAAWDPQGANFAKVLIDGSRYRSLREATNALSDSLFAIEDIKDRRLGRPLGLHKDCTNPERKCVDKVEHPWSGLALKAIVARLGGLLAVVRGGRRANAPGFGLDDLLTDSGHAQVGADFARQVQEAYDRAHAVDGLGALADQITAMKKEDLDRCRNSADAQAPVPVCALFQDIRNLNVFVKTEFLSVLSLRAPPKFQGDNDDI